MPPESSRLGVVGRPSHERARGPRNLGRFPIRDPRDGRLDGGLGGRAARSNGEREHPERRGPPYKGRRAPDLWDVRYPPEGSSNPRTRSPPPSTKGSCSGRYLDSRRSFPLHVSSGSSCCRTPRWLWLSSELDLQVASGHGPPSDPAATLLGKRDLFGSAIHTQRPEHLG
jgi:hypothetical protein